MTLSFPNLLLLFVCLISILFIVYLIFFSVFLFSFYLINIFFPLGIGFGFGNDDLKKKNES